MSETKLDNEPASENPTAAGVAMNEKFPETPKLPEGFEDLPPEEQQRVIQALQARLIAEWDQLRESGVIASPQ